MEQYNNEDITYFYDENGRLIREKHLEYSLIFGYDPKNKLTSISYLNSNNVLLATYFYVIDGLGNVVALVDNSGRRIVSYYYDGYGNTLEKIISSNDTYGIGNKNPFRYKCYYYDVETGLFMMGHRYYSPELCRFIQPDDIEYLDPSSINGLNLYCYCFNNPIMYVDSFGHFPVAIEAIIIFLDGVMGLYQFGLKRSLKSLKNAPKITMEVAKKMARKGGHIQSARQIMRNQQKLIDSTQQSLDDVVNFGKKMGKVLLVADIAWSLGENILSGEESWFTDTLVDAGVSLAIYGLSLLPGGFFIALAATVATFIWEDEIEEFKDNFYKVWSNFWSFSWI